MVDTNAINDFIIKVFNYYNGRINIINKAVLDINWANLIGCQCAGYSRLPNVITINPMVTIRFYEYNDENTIKVNLIETIIHELYHTDQIINYHLYMADANYNKFIEHSCELQTVIYMAWHQQEIYNVFGLNTFIDKNTYNMVISYWDRCGANYQRRYFHDHVFMCIDNMCNFNPEEANQIYQGILEAIEDKKNITIDVNGDVIPVYINGVPIPIDNFNKSMIKYHGYTATWNAKYDINCDNDGNILAIIKIEQYLNIMCKKV